MSPCEPFQQTIKSYRCNECGKYLYSYFIQHQKILSAEKSFQWKICRSISSRIHILLCTTELRWAGNPLNVRDEGMLSSRAHLSRIVRKFILEWIHDSQTRVKNYMNASVPAYRFHWLWNHTERGYLCTECLVSIKRSPLISHHSIQTWGNRWISWIE